MCVCVCVCVCVCDLIQILTFYVPVWLGVELKLGDKGDLLSEVRNAGHVPSSRFDQAAQRF